MHYLNKKQSDGPGQFAGVALRIEPLPRCVVSDVTGGAMPREFISSLEDGARRAARSGVLEDGSFHERDSSSLDYGVDCIGHLNRRRATARKQAQVGSAAVIHAIVPM